MGLRVRASLCFALLLLGFSDGLALNFLRWPQKVRRLTQPVHMVQAAVVKTAVDTVTGTDPGRAILLGILSNVIRRPLAAIAALGAAWAGYYGLGYVFQRIFGYEHVVKRVAKAFAEGRISHDHSPFFQYMQRSDLHARLNKAIFLRRPEKISQYFVIAGEDGVGKTTALKEAIRALPMPKGAAYMEIDNVRLFAKDLARLVRFEPSSLNILSFFPAKFQEPKHPPEPYLFQEPMGTWERLKPAIVSAAELFSSGHNHSFTLVFDNLDRVAEYDDAEGTRILADLQDFAERAADVHQFNVVLVTGNGPALARLQARPAFSRACVIEVDDLREEDAVRYLQQRDIPRHAAAEAVKLLAGGRLSALNAFYTSYDQNVTIESQLAAQYHHIRVAVEESGVPCNHSLFSTLRRRRWVPRFAPAAEDVPPEAVHTLLAERVLAAHSNATYTFAGRAVESFFEGVEADPAMYEEYCATTGMGLAA